MSRLGGRDAHASHRFLHRCASDGHTVRHGDVLLLADAEPVVLVQGNAGERRHQRQRAKSLRPGCGLAGLENGRAQTASSPVPAHEHGSNPGRLRVRVEPPDVAGRRAGAGVQLVAQAPSATGDQLSLDLDHVVGAVLDEHAVDGRDVLDARLRLRGVVKGRKEGARGVLHERVDRRLVV